MSKNAVFSNMQNNDLSQNKYAYLSLSNEVFHFAGGVLGGRFLVEDDKREIALLARSLPVVRPLDVIHLKLPPNFSTQ